MTTENRTSSENTIKKSSRGRLPDGGANPIDIHVGNRIRLRRTNLTMSQETLADLLGITFQQVQKYERGMNRIGASRLWDMSKVLAVPVSYFFEEMGKEVTDQSPRKFHVPKKDLAISEDEDFWEEADPMHKQESIKLITAYYKIHNRNLAKMFYTMLMELSRSVPSQDQEIVTDLNA